MTAITQQRERFGHLLGIDRLRVVSVCADGSTETESWDEETLSLAMVTAAALLAPGATTGGTPAFVEIRLGCWTANGATDCEWRDARMAATGRICEGEVVWTEQAEPVLDPVYGEQLTLI